MKRPLPQANSSEPAAKKLRLVKHSLKVKQHGADEAVAGDSDEEYIQLQLERAISLALAAVGFDGVKLDALEAFRMHVDEYMIHFLSTVRAYASAAHRSQAVPQDFIAALAEANIRPSSLHPLLKAPLPPSITQPPLILPPPEIPAPPPVEALLGAKLSGHDLMTKKRYIPSHIPDLPSRHTWQSTGSVQKRETDPRKVREEATSEGITAERALRKLAVKQRETVHRKAVRDRRLSRRQRDQEMWEQTIKGMQVLDEEERRRADAEEDVMESDGRNWGLMVDGAADASKASLEYGAGTMVNFERQYFRRGAQMKV